MLEPGRQRQETDRAGITACHRQGTQPVTPSPATLPRPRGQPGCPGDMSAPVPAMGMLLQHNPGVNRAGKATEHQSRAWRKGTEREEKPGSHQGSRHTGWELSAGAKKQRRAPRGTAKSQSSARNHRQDTPEHAQGHKSSSSAATNQPAALQGQEGIFRRGKVISLSLLSASAQDTGAQHAGLRIPAVFSGK